MSLTWPGRRTCTRLAVAGVTLGALVSAAPLVSASALGGLTAVSSPVAGPVVGTADGAVRGLAVPISGGTVNEFLGIPYAAPPVGALRWQPPQAAASWSGVRDATQFAPHCPEPASPFGLASTSEDCLFLEAG
jgi:para-nitrobenzyl esterase